MPEPRAVRSPVRRPGARSVRGSARNTALVVVGIVVPLAAAVFAVPRLMSADNDDVLVAPQGPAAVVAATRPRGSADGSAREVEDALAHVAPQPVAEPRSAPAAAPVATPVEVTEDGDLVLVVELPWRSFAAGSRVHATVRVRNHSLHDVHLPAAGEAHPTLALVVVDAEGREVRRVVESGSDELPTQTVLVRSGGTAELPLAIVADGEGGLEPGEYTAYAEMDADPRWRRLGLPVWTAPNGVLCSRTVHFSVR
jgi:hypothetical protein